LIDQANWILTETKEKGFQRENRRVSPDFGASSAGRGGKRGVTVHSHIPKSMKIADVKGDKSTG